MNDKIAKASRMARRKKPKPKKAEGGELLRPPESPADVAPIREGLGAMAHEVAVKPFTDAYKAMTGKMSDQEQEEFGVNQMMGMVPMGKAIMVGAAGARALGRGMTHPVVAADMARQAKLPKPSIEEAGVGAYRNHVEGRLPDASKPMGDIQAQGVLDYRRGIGNPSDEGVWGKSAWHRGADGESRKELVDVGSRLEKNQGTSDQFTWRHPAGDVHAAYKMPPITVTNEPGAAGVNAAGSYDPMTGRIVIGQSPNTQKGVAKAGQITPHEVTHRIQGESGFAVGSNPIAEPMFDDYWKALGYVPPSSLGRRAAVTQFLDKKHREIGVRKDDPEMTTYNRSSGEVEARNVARRREKSFLYQKHPAETEDIPRSEQIIRKQSDVNDVYRRLNDGLQARADGGGTGYADGGMPATPWYVRNESRNMNTAGGLNSSVAGRTDHLPIKVASGSYVLPADVVSGLGQGNTSNGMKVLGSMFAGGPFGAKAPKMKGGSSAPKPPKPMKFADGGGIAGLADDPSMDQMAPDDPAMDQMDDGTADMDGIDIAAAGGEYVVPPEVVEAIGNGDIDLGHEILDAFVKSTRNDTVKELKKLPGPVKD